jgi:hypothetical protein
LEKSKGFRRRVSSLTPGEELAACDAIRLDPGRVEFHPNFFRQIVFPMVFGAKSPISLRDVQSVNEHFPEQEDKCIKFINSYAVTFASNTPGALTINPVVGMDCNVFYERMVTLAGTSPGLFLRALIRVGLMGPNFFESGPFMPKGLPYMFERRSLPLAFAEYIQDLVEQPASKKRK